MAKKGTHVGSFAKGFSDSLIAWMRMYLMQQHWQALQKHYDAMEAHWNSMGMNKGATDRTIAEAEREGAGKPINWGGTSPVKGEDTEMRDHIVKWSQDHGKNPDEALAIWRQESAGGTNMVGDGKGAQASSFGDFQFHFGGINPSMPNKGMGDDFLKDTGIDLRTDNSKEARYKAADYALERASQKGWGDWATSVKVTGVPNKWSDAAKPTETAAAPSGKFKVKDTGVIKGDTTQYPAPTEKGPSGKPTQTATVMEATTPAPGGGFRIPGEEPIPPLTATRGVTGETYTVPGGDEAAGTRVPPGYVPTYQRYPESTNRPTGLPAIPAPVPGGPAYPPTNVQPPQPINYPTGLPQITSTARPSTVPPTPTVTPPLSPADRISNIQAHPYDTTARSDITAPVVGGDERRQPAAASQPTAAATPVSAQPSAAVPAIPTNPRFVQFDRPNMDPNNPARGGPPQMSMLNLGSLWGPNPPLVQRQPAPAAPQPAGGPSSGNLVLNQPGQPVRSVPVPTPPVRPAITPRVIAQQDIQLPTGDISTAARRGGPIMRFAGGGATTDGGVTPYYGGGPSNGQMASLAGMGINYPGYATSPYATTLKSLDQAMYGANYTPDQFGSQTGQQVAANVAALTPAQQQWVTSANTDLSQTRGMPSSVQNTVLSGLGAYPSATPAPATSAAVTPAPAPAPVVAPTVATINAAPATTDTTTTSGAGAPNLPNTVAPTAVANTAASNANPAGFTNTQSTGGTNYSVATDDTLKSKAGYRRGGAIPRYAGGGTVMGYAAGAGVAPTAAMLADPGWQNTMSTYQPSPRMGFYTNERLYQVQQNELKNAGPNTLIMGPSNNPTGTNLNQYYGAWSPPAPAPAPAAPAAQPAPAPTTVTQTPAATTPDTTSGAGAPSLPNTVAPTTNPVTTTPAPVIPPTTYTATSPPAPIIPPTIGTQNAGVGEMSTNLTPPTIFPTSGQQSDQTQNVGGTNYGRNPNTSGAVQGFDLGGDVSGSVSPSATGMPPGLGGAMPVPPIYFNPATYAAAGAPVGKGISASSAPTYKAGAIPTLPMFRGGAVGYQEGGSVDPTEADMQNSVYEQQGVAQEDAAVNREVEGAQVEPVVATSDNPPVGGTSGYYAPPTLEQPKEQPKASTSRNAPPPGALPFAPQGSDDEGHPSPGFIGWLTDGLHWLGNHFGLVGGAQAAGIAADPQVQQNRRGHATGDTELNMPIENINAQDDLADPKHVLEPDIRRIMGMEQARNVLMQMGKAPEAAKMAASEIYTLGNIAAQHGEAAASLLYDGHVKEAVDQINLAAQSMPVGMRVKATYNEKTGQADITGSDLKGREIWKQYVAPQALYQLATGIADKSLYYTALEHQASRYDGTYKEMADNRRKNQQEDAIAAASRKFGPKPITPQSDRPAVPQPAQPSAPITTAENAPAAPQPAVAPAIPGGPAVSAPPNMPGAGADTSGQAVVAAKPPGADGANAPALPGPGQQVVAETDFDKIAASLNHQENIGRQQIVLDTTARYEAQKQQYPDESQITSEYDRPAYNEAVQRVNTYNKSIDEARSKDIEAQQKAFSDQIAAQRQRLQAQESEFRQQRGFGQQEKMKQESADLQAQRDARLKQLQSGLDQSNDLFKANLGGSAPRNDQEMNGLVGEGKTFDPYVGIAQAFNPDLDPNANRAQAMNDLKQRQPWADANTQRTLAAAYDQSVRHSRNSTPEEIGAGIQSYVTGGHYVFSAEAVDNGVAAPRHGVVRYDVSVQDNSGNMLSFRLPANDFLNLRNLRERYTSYQTSEIGRQVSTPGWTEKLGLRSSSAPTPMSEGNYPAGP